MRVKNVQLIAAAYGKKEFPPENLPEIAFLGRSNVGKSSLINCLLGRKKFAAVSSTPGKTRLLHFYAVDNLFCLVDLPGYGYARVSRERRRAWAPVIEDYLLERTTLRCCVHIVDVRIEPTADDRMLRRWLDHHGLRAVTVASKVDKVSRGALAGLLRRIGAALELPEEEAPLPFSAVMGTGLDRLWRLLNDLV